MAAVLLLVVSWLPKLTMLASADSGPTMGVSPRWPMCQRLTAEGSVPTPSLLTWIPTAAFGQMVPGCHQACRQRRQLAMLGCLLGVM